MGTENLSRRTLAKGAAWSVPVIAASAVAPAYAASRTIVGGTVCDLFYSTGTNSNQTHSVYLGVTSNDGTIPQGTTFTWTVNMSGGNYTQLPSTSYSRVDAWSLSLSPSSSSGNLSSFEVTLTVNSDTTPEAIGCGPALVWTDSYLISPGATISISSTATGSNIASGTASSLSYVVAKRYPSGANDTGRTAHRYLSKSGGQTCYPPIRYTLNSSTQFSDCRASGAINSTSTIYPDGSCAQIVSRSTQVGSQGNIAQKC